MADRPMRADARRNRDAILRAAQEAFEVEGVMTSIDGIAVRAGVGNATLYRNFPTRDDLLVAVIDTTIGEAVTEADELCRDREPQAALTEWLVRLTWQLRIWHDLPTCLADAHDDASSPVPSALAPLVTRTGTLLTAAGADAATATEVFELVLALSWAVDRFGDDEATARRRVTTAMAGITAVS